MSDWRDTAWVHNGEQVTLSDVIDHLSAQEPVDINILELTRYLLPGGIPDWEYNQERVAAASLEYPIIIVKSAGQYRFVLDGNHRFQKATLQKSESIKARILDLDSPETPEVFKKMFHQCDDIELEEVGNGDYARMRPQIFRLQSTQAEAIAETKRSVRLMSTVVVLVFIAGLSWIVVSNFGLM